MRGNYMKKILLLLFLFVGFVNAQNLLKVVDKPKYARGSAIDLDGSTEYMSKSPPVNLNLNGTERITATDDRTFETTKGTWADNGNHSAVRSTTDKKTGTASLAMTSTAVGDVTTNFISLPSTSFTALQQDANSIYEKYTLEMWARGTGIVSETDLLAGWNFTSGWSTSGPATISDSNTFVTTALAGIYKTSGNMTIGVTYKLTISGTVSAGSLNIRDAGTTTIYGIVSGTFNTTIYFVAKHIQLFLQNTTAATTDIITLTLQAITNPSITFACGNQTNTIANISCVPGTFTKLVWNFQATANEINQPIKVYANQADAVYLDDVSLTKAWDAIILTWIKSGNSSTNSGIAGYGVITTGYNFYFRMDNYNQIIFETSDNAIRQTSINFSWAGYSNNQYHLVAGYFNHSGTSSLYIDGVSKSSGNTNNLGKIFAATSFIIGQLSSAFFSGQIGETQIVRFTDISQSNVNASTLLNAYKLGIPRTWIGGSPQVVAHYKFKGTTDAQMLNDISGTGNSLSGTNVATADKTTGTYPSK